MRKSLGVDSLEVGAGPGGPSVGVSRTIGDRLSVGAPTGATTSIRTGWTSVGVGTPFEG